MWYVVFDLIVLRLCYELISYLMLTLNDSQGGPLIMDTGDGPLQVGVTSVGVCELYLCGLLLFLDIMHLTSNPHE